MLVKSHQLHHIRRDMYFSMSLVSFSIICRIIPLMSAPTPVLFFFLWGFFSSMASANLMRKPGGNTLHQQACELMCRCEVCQANELKTTLKYDWADDE